MSDPDAFLARWSRRKREAAAKAAEPAAEAPAPAAPTPEVPPEVPPVDPATLPPIESIAAGTDIRAFLAEGVAPDLTRAALRRAWLADPAIRDFVGLADYAWDFNAPDAVAGFGPLLPTDDVGQLLAQMLGNEAPAPRDAEPKPTEPPVVAASKSGEIAAEEGNLAGHTDEPSSELPGRPDDAPQPQAQNSAEVAATQYSNLLDEGAAPPIRRSHGGALPE